MLINDNDDYLVNLDGEVIHRFPAFEQCNTDDIIHKTHVKGAVLADLRYVGFDHCQFCFSETT